MHHMKVNEYRRWNVADDWSGKGRGYRVDRDEGLMWPSAKNKFLLQSYPKVSIEHQWLSALLRAEMRTPRQVSIEQRWKSERDKLLPSVQAPAPEATLPLRNRLVASGSVAAITGIMEGVTLWPTTPVAALGMAGVALATGVGGFIHFRRPRPSAHTAIETTPVAKPNTTGLDEHNRTLLQTTYSGTMLDKYATMHGEHYYDFAIGDALPTFAVERDTSDRLLTVLRWLDKGRAERVQASTRVFKDADDKAYTRGLLSHTYEQFEHSEVNEAFSLASTSTTPLSLLALVRMKDPGGFMDAFHDEFGRFTQAQEYMRSTDQQNLQVYIQSAGSSYETQQAYTASRMARHAAKVADIRLASLAYSYDKRLLQPEQLALYSSEQNVQWQAAMGVLCSLPLTSLAPEMQELMTSAARLCMELQPSDTHGKKAAEIVRHIAAVQMDVDTENRHTEAWRHIEALADE